MPDDSNDAKKLPATSRPSEYPYPPGTPEYSAQDYWVTPPTVYEPREKEPMPDYVTPRTDVPPVGALSAEALVRDFEHTAKRIEHMGAELAVAGRKCAVELTELADKFKEMDTYIDKVLDHVNETAAALREEAKLVFLRIENTTLMTKEMRDLSENMRNRVTGAPPPQAQPATRIPSVDFDLVEQVEKELNRRDNE